MAAWPIGGPDRRSAKGKYSGSGKREVYQGSAVGGGGLGEGLKRRQLWPAVWLAAVPELLHVGVGEASLVGLRVLDELLPPLAAFEGRVFIIALGPQALQMRVALEAGSVPQRPKMAFILRSLIAFISPMRSVEISLHQSVSLQLVIFVVLSVVAPDSGDGFPARQLDVGQTALTSGHSGHFLLTSLLLIS